MRLGAMQSVGDGSWERESCSDDEKADLSEWTRRTMLEDTDGDRRGM